MVIESNPSRLQEFGNSVEFPVFFYLGQLALYPPLARASGYAFFDFLLTFLLFWYNITDIDEVNPRFCTMKKKSKLELATAAFREAGGILTMSEAIDIGIHRRELYALRDKGDLEVVSRGLYRLVDMPAPSLPDFIPVAKKIPHGVICLISALAFHEITTQIPHFVYVALPSQAHKPMISHPPMRYFWYS